MESGVRILIPFLPKETSSVSAYWWYHTGLTIHPEVIARQGPRALAQEPGEPVPPRSCPGGIVRGTQFPCTSYSVPWALTRKGLCIRCPILHIIDGKTKAQAGLETWLRFQNYSELEVGPELKVLLSSAHCLLMHSQDPGQLSGGFLSPALLTQPQPLCLVSTTAEARGPSEAGAGETQAPTQTLNTRPLGAGISSPLLASGSNKCTVSSSPRPI